MLSTLLIVSFVFWLLGVITSYTLAGLIHILLVVAIIMVLVRVFRAATRSLDKHPAVGVLQPY